MTDQDISAEERIYCNVCGHSSSDREYMQVHMQRPKLTAPNGSVLTYDRKSLEVFPFGFFPEQGFCVLSGNKETGFAYDINHNSLHDLTALEREGSSIQVFKKLASGRLLEYINHGHLRLLTPQEVEEFNERAAKFGDCGPEQFRLVGFLFNPDNLDKLLRRV